MTKIPETIILCTGRYSPTWILEENIKDCFYNINHQLELDSINIDRAVKIINHNES